MAEEHAERDLANIINAGNLSQESECAFYCCLALPVVGCCFLNAKMILVQQGEYGFSLNNGVPQIYFAGRHFLLSPLNELQGIHNIGKPVIQVGPVTIVRVPIGSIGLAMNNSLAEILLPGVHCRNNAAFNFQNFEKLDKEMIEFGPIKIFIVRSGGVRVCYVNGRVTIFNEGRYAVCSTSFNMAQLIVTQQQNHRFSEHKVMLMGGIRMVVEGLLTYQVNDVEQLIHQLGDRELLRCIEDVSEAELARIFSSVHLEKISASSLQGHSVVGGEAVDASAEGKERAIICQKVIAAIKPILASWGVSVINFQLESTALADRAYAREYEAASLEMAKAQANLRALAAQNELLLSQSRAKAEAQRLQAEGEKAKSVAAAEARAEAVKVEAEATIKVAQSQKEALLIRVGAEADARVLESKSRNDAGEAMNDAFAQKLALSELQVQFGGALEAKNLIMMHEPIKAKH